MHKNDLIFLGFALGAALYFAGASILASQTLLFPPEHAPEITDAIGQPRTIDPEQIRRKIEQKQLSGREADFYGIYAPE